MTDNELLTAATHLYVRLRRSSGRVIDVLWAVRNPDYAREVLRLAREQADPEITALADRFEAAAFGYAVRDTTPDIVLPTPRRRGYAGALR